MVLPYFTALMYHEGEAALEAKGSYLFNEHDGADAWGGEVVAGYGVTSFWHAEFGLEFEGHEDEDTDLTALLFENKFQLAPQGEWPVDVGMKIDYARSLTGGPDEIGAKLLLAKDIGHFTNLSNIAISREIGEDSSDDNEYGFSYGLSYNVNDHFAIGGEWHSDFGSLERDSDDFNEQSHRFGPVAYGELAEGVHYETGLLAGVSDSAPDAELKAVVEYEF